VPDFYINSNSAQDDSDATWNSSTLSFLDTTEYLADGASGVGDEVWYASDHLEQYSSNTTLSFYDDSLLVSVNSSTNILEAGAHIETISGIYDLNIRTDSVEGTIFIDGVNLTARDDLTLSMAGSQYYLSNLTLALTGTNSLDKINMDIDGLGVFLNNVSTSVNLNGQRIKTGHGVKLVINGGSLTAASTSFLSTVGNGGSTCNINNYDFSAMTSGNIVDLTSAVDDTVNLDFIRCKIPASGVGLVDTDKVFNRTQVINFYSCDNGNGYYYFKHYMFGGIVEQNTTVKRTDGATYYASIGFSAKFSTNLDVVEFVSPLIFRLKIPALDLSGGITTLRVHILLDDSVEIPTSLTTKNCRLRAVYPDAINTALGKTIYSNPTVNILTAATDLPTETVTFTGHSGTNQKQHYLDVEIPQNTATGMDEAVCELWLEVSKDLSTGTTEMFVCPEPTVS